VSEIILHIGDGKCGSSSIQSALFNAKAELEKAGTIYISERKNSAYNFSIFLGGHTRGNPESERAAAAENLSEIANSIKINKYDYIIISSEFLFKYQPFKIFDLFSDFGIQHSGAHVIAFIRDPVSRYESALQQHVKGDHTYPNPLNFKHDFSRPLGQWAAHKHCLSLSVFSLDEMNLYAGSVVKSFFQMLNLINPLVNIDPEDFRTNESLSAEQAITLQEFRAKYCADTPRQMRPESDRIISFFQCINQKFGRVGSPVRVTDQVRAILENRHQEIVQNAKSLAPWVFPDHNPPNKISSDFNYEATPLRSILKGWDETTLENLKLITDPVMNQNDKSFEIASNTLGLDFAGLRSCVSKTLR